MGDTQVVLCKCGVDAGLMSIADFNFYPDEEHTQKEYSETGKIIEVTPGKYKVRLFIKDCWDGTVDKTGILNIPSGKIVIGDPCYGFDDHDLWIKMLYEYDYFMIDDEKIISTSTGGDGCFDVKVTLERIE
jgi:hypothetical protein